MPNALLDQWNPSRAINAGLSLSGLAPSGISQFLNLGYGAYNGFNGLTSQNNEGFWGRLDPTEPGLFQNAGEWLGSGIANLLGYGHPQMGLAEGMRGGGQFMSSGMQGGSQMFNAPTGMGNYGGLYGANTTSLPSTGSGSGGGFFDDPWAYLSGSQAQMSKGS